MNMNRKHTKCLLLAVLFFMIGFGLARANAYDSIPVVDANGFPVAAVPVSMETAKRDLAMTPSGQFLNRHYDSFRILNLTDGAIMPVIYGYGAFFLIAILLINLHERSHQDGNSESRFRRMISALHHQIKKGELLMK